MSLTIFVLLLHFATSFSLGPQKSNLFYHLSVPKQWFAPVLVTNRAYTGQGLGPQHSKTSPPPPRLTWQHWFSTHSSRQIDDLRTLSVTPKPLDLTRRFVYCIQPASWILNDHVNTHPSTRLAPRDAYHIKLPYAERCVVCLARLDYS